MNLSFNLSLVIIFILVQCLEHFPEANTLYYFANGYFKNNRFIKLATVSKVTLHFQYKADHLFNTGIGPGNYYIVMGVNFAQ
jgi:hypothetical protein